MPHTSPRTASKHYTYQLTYTQNFSTGADEDGTVTVEYRVPQTYPDDQSVAGHRRLTKILICVTEEWFLLSHFRPLVAQAQQLADEVVVVTKSSGRTSEVEALGVRVIPLDYSRGSINPLRQAFSINRLRRVLKSEVHDVVHVIGLQAIAQVLVALRLINSKSSVMLHLTGLGFLGSSEKLSAKVIRRALRKGLSHEVQRPEFWLLVENPADLDFLIDRPISAVRRYTLLGGAGVDPDEFPLQKTPGGTFVRAAFVGRMLWSKGVDVFVKAAEILHSENVRLQVDLWGAADQGSPGAIPHEILRGWDKMDGISWHGATNDVREVWRNSHIAVVPSLGGEGLPRALLEAAASGRPLVVSNVPGCRDFVRSGQEGLIVPPGDARALAGALRKLIEDEHLRTNCGLAARSRVLEAYTENSVKEKIAFAYQSLAASRAKGKKCD